MLRFDHAVIFVPDLSTAVRSYTGLGFSVLPGGAHEGDPTQNALIPLADGTYLELIAFRRRSTLVLLKILARFGLVTRVARGALARRFAMRAAQGAGLVDIVLAVDTLAPVLAAARRAGCAIHGPMPGQRKSAEGTPIAWELGVPEHDELPLLIADVTPRERRLGAAGHAGHRNGVTGVTEVVLPVRDPAGAAARFRDVFGLLPHQDDQRVVVTSGTTTLVLQPDTGGCKRPISLTLRSERPATLDPRATHGAVLELR